VNRQFSELTSKYRDLLQKEHSLVRWDVMNLTWRMEKTKNRGKCRIDIIWNIVIEPGEFSQHEPRTGWTVLSWHLINFEVTLVLIMENHISFQFSTLSRYFFPSFTFRDVEWLYKWKNSRKIKPILVKYGIEEVREK
jgi:hypothetical protein